MKTYYSNGKLLITGEYLVLDGALSLALPTTYGQSLTVNPIKLSKLLWKSIDCNNEIWFENELSLDEISKGLSTTHDDVSNKLIQILNAAQQLNPDFLNLKSGFEVTTKLDFPKNWGLGSSSTLINNIANWANVDAYKLLELTFGGSGYDIACAQYNSAITYQLKDKKPLVNSVAFKPEFKDNLYFVFLNQKQNSRDAIAHYKTNKSNTEVAINEINDITTQMMSCKTIDEFSLLIDKHETIISKTIHQKTVKEQLFNDFKGSIKSLGAWGGDFVLVACKENPIDYFKNKGYQTVIRYSNMIL